ncbi:MAG: endonuclease III [Candidatus Zixiibacteriota bacterium]|nr:MAG: endonuclease III [candidate division Zixibacteria bacterium]
MKVSDNKQNKLHAREVIALLKKAYPDSTCSLEFETPHQLLVATILSAQCTDERVNIVTKNLFEKYRNPDAFAEAEIGELENDIRSTGFFRNKARAIKESARVITNDFGGKVPRTLDELTRLPGVGRKTGSVVLGTGFGRAEGIVVDTHVARISRRLRFTDEKSPLKIEKDLMAIIPPEYWIVYSHMLIDHGRAVCKARKPDCDSCPLAKLCPSAGHF